MGSFRELATMCTPSGMGPLLLGMGVDVVIKQIWKYNWFMLDVFSIVAVLRVCYEFACDPRFDLGQSSAQFSTHPINNLLGNL